MRPRLWIALVVLTSVSALVVAHLRAEAESLVAEQADRMDGPTPRLADATRLGNRAAPVPLGTAAALGDGWTLTVLEVTPNATDLILATNPFTAPPAPGYQFFMARVAATFGGDQPVGPYGAPSTFTLRAMGKTGVEYASFKPGGGCGAGIPDELADFPLFTAWSVAGTVCWQIRSADADFLLLFYQRLADLSPPLPRTYFAAGTARATDGLLYRDDFTDPLSGWPREAEDRSTRRVGYEGGEYFVARLPGSTGAPFVTHPEQLADFLAEIDARLLPATEDRYLYLVFRRQGSGDHYAYVVDPDRRAFLLRRQSGGRGATLIGWTHAAAIEAGAASNRLGVRARGSEIVLLANGQEVGRVRDEALRAGTLGLGVGSRIDGPAEARFAHLRVSTVD